MLQATDITCAYDDTVVLESVSLRVEPGDIIGLIGPNGSGKTTLLRALSGVLQPSSGQILLEGRDIHEMPSREIARRVAAVSQDPVVDFSFDVRELVMMGRTPHIGRLGWETKHDLDIVKKAMEYLDVAHLADRPITEISGGERQRVFIAMALAQEPRVLLLDEATSHLDIDHQLGILDLIHQRNREEGLTVLLVSHDLNLAADYCDKLVLLNEGRIMLTGSPEEVVTEENIRRVYRAQVRLQRNPVTGRPHLLLVPGAASGKAPAGGSETAAP